MPRKLGAHHGDIHDQRTQHVEFSVCEIHNAHSAEDKSESDCHQQIEHTEHEPIDEGLRDDDFNRHGSASTRKLGRKNRHVGLFIQTNHHTLEFYARGRVHLHDQGIVTRNHAVYPACRGQ